MSLPFHNNEPLYIQIVQLIKRMIVSGTYAAGEKIPSIREMAIQFSVTPNTVQRALQILEQEDLIYTARTYGKYITNDKQRIAKLREEVLSDSVHRIVEELLAHNYSSSEVSDTIAKELNRHGRTEPH